MDKITEKILNFWFSQDTTSKWFVKSEDFDKQVKEHFLSIYQDYLDEKIRFANKPKEALASIILLDQFPRNMFRDTPKAFATDEFAISISRNAIEQGAEFSLNEMEQMFLYMPFMHSEILDEQLYCVELYTKLGREENLKFAIAHKDIIERFGRFPHRNEILGRNSTNEEIEFLKQDGSSF